jgi:hypothetical protein
MGIVLLCADDQDRFLKEKVRAVLQSTTKRLYIYFSGKYGEYVRAPVLAILFYISNERIKHDRSRTRHIGFSVKPYRQTFMHKVINQMKSDAKNAAGYAEETPTTQLLTTIASLYDLTAVERPCLDVVPLLPFAGWTPGEILGSTSTSAHSQGPGGTLLSRSRFIFFTSSFVCK